MKRLRREKCRLLENKCCCYCCWLEQQQQLFAIGTHFHRFSLINWPARGSVLNINCTSLLLCIFFVQLLICQKICLLGKSVKAKVFQRQHVLQTTVKDWESNCLFCLSRCLSDSRSGILCHLSLFFTFSFSSSVRQFVTVLSVIPFLSSSSSSSSLAQSTSVCCTHLPMAMKATLKTKNCKQHISIADQHQNWVSEWVSEWRKRSWVNWKLAQCVLCRAGPTRAHRRVLMRQIKRCQRF